MGEKASNYLLYFSSEQLPGCNFDSVDRISNLRYGIVCPYIDSIPGATRWGKVWSLTQFYYVEFSQSRIGEKSAFSTNAQSRFASVVVDGVLGPPRLAHHT